MMRRVSARPWFVVLLLLAGRGVAYGHEPSAPLIRHAGMPRPRVHPFTVTAGGLMRREAAGSVVTLRPQSDDFASGSGVGVVGGTSEVNLDSVGAYDNAYTVHYSVAVTINGHASLYGTATLVVALESNDGSGWVERAKSSYGCSYPPGPPLWSTTTCSSWSLCHVTTFVWDTNGQLIEITVPGTGGGG